MSKLNELTIKQALSGLEKGEFSSAELTRSHIDAIEQNRELNAYITDSFDIALEAANASDKKRASKSGKLGLMEGIPVGVKDLFCTKGVKSTSCSHILDGFTPTYESTVTTKLFAEGAVMLGKTNMDEFAMGSTNTTSYYGAVKNPYKRKDDSSDLVPGGSSGGSAAAVAKGLAMGALGSDTGGSVRQPAAFCGVVGVKPTYGMCSRWGMIAFASSLDQAGVFTRNVHDAAIMLEAISGHDPKDSTSAPVEVPNFSKILHNLEIKGLRIGIPKEYRQDNMPAEMDALWQKGASWLKDNGAEIVDISLPHTKYALPTYYIIAPAEASANLARYDGVRYGLRVRDENGNLDDMYELTRAKGFGTEVKRRIMIGTYVLSAGYYDAYYKKAQRVRTLVARDFANVFENVDVILTPTTPTPAFKIGEKMDPVTMYLNDVFTVPASLAGLPGISVPAGFSAHGTPLGLQLIGKAFNEETLFKVAAVIEGAAGFKGIV